MFCAWGFSNLFCTPTKCFRRKLSGAAFTFNEIVILTTRGSDRIELYLRDYGTRQP